MDQCNLDGYDYGDISITTLLENVYLKSDTLQTTVDGLITKESEIEYQLETITDQALEGEYWADIKIGFEGEPTTLQTTS